MKYQTVLYDLDYFLSQILHILIQQDSQYEHAQLMYFPSFFLFIFIVLCFCLCMSIQSSFRISSSPFLDM